MYYNNYSQQASQQPPNQQYQSNQPQYNNQGNYYPNNYQQYGYQNQYDSYNNQYGFSGDQHQQIGLHQGHPANPQQTQPPDQSQWGESMQATQISTFLNQYIPMQLSHESSNYQFNQIQNELQMMQNFTNQYTFNPELEVSLMHQISQLTKDQKMQTLQEFNNASGAILGQISTPNLSHLLILLTFAKTSPEQLKKLMLSYPQSLCKYIEKSFQKCMNFEERLFMENELKSISMRCKEREILFTRDWDVVTPPVLVRESPTTYQKINQIIKDGDQGVIQRVHEQIHQQKLPSEQAVHQSNQESAQNQSYSFNFTGVNNYQQMQPNFFQEQKQRNSKLLDKIDQTFSDDLQFVRRQEHYSSSPKKQSLIMPAESSNSFQRQESQQEEHVTIVGTCQTLEKSYFRLTSAPDPNDVRPEEVLYKSLKLISKKWKKQQADYRYIDEQFRSMRQDLTVQRIQNSLSIKIYETHARIALEMADLDQFNQCQTQLHYIYKLKIEGGNYIEFLAYKILYQILCEIDMEVLRTLRQLTDDEKKENCIEHALNLRKALATGNYGRFFKLFQTAPNMGTFLIGIFIDKHRILCLQKLCFANQNSNLELNRLTNLLAFESKDELLKFLTGLECIIVDESHFDCRQSMIKLKNAPLKVKRCQK